MLSLLRRPDFLDLAFCAISIYAYMMSHTLNKNSLRVASTGCFFSILFDIVFIVIFSEYYWNKVQGWDMDLAVRRFVIIITYIKLIFKVPFSLLLWKICVDFEETVRYK